MHNDFSDARIQFFKKGENFWLNIKHVDLHHAETLAIPLELGFRSDQGLDGFGGLDQMARHHQLE